MLGVGAGAGAGAVSWVRLVERIFCSLYSDSYGALIISKDNELAVRAFAPVLVSADCARCGGAVSWLRKLRIFLFQPVACQQVVGFCLGIWVYAGEISGNSSSKRGLCSLTRGNRNLRGVNWNNRLGV